jgi:hypothetical protein
MFSSSIEAAMAKTSVEVNGVYIRFNKAVDALTRFCRPLAFYNIAAFAISSLVNGNR